MNRRIAHLLLWGVGLLPALVALLAVPLPATEEPAAVLNLLGRLTGIAGLGLMLVAAIVSFRIPGFDRWFGGLTTLWRTHHLLGGVAFLLLLLHPLLLALAAAEISLTAAVSVLFPATGGTATWAGWGALVLMMVFLAPSFSFFGEPDYQRWKGLHRLSGIAVALALLHTFWLQRSIPAPWSGLIWLSLTLAAVVALVYGLVLTRRFSQYRYRVSGLSYPANNVVELSLQPEGRPLPYRAGQFVYLTPYDPGLESGQREEHPYTLSSAPEESQLRTAIKSLGDASRAIQTIAVGSEVRVTGPYGAFFPAHCRERELWIAGGIGITPFLGRARHLAALQRQQPAGREPISVQLIFCVQDEARALYAEELQQLSEEIPGFELTMHYFYQHGPLTADFVRYHCPDCAERQVYACGPGPLNQLARRILLDLGAPRRNFHSEDFDLL